MKAIDKSELVTVTGGKTATSSNRSGSLYSGYGSTDQLALALRKITTGLEEAKRDQQNPNQALTLAMFAMAMRNRSFA